MAINRRAEHIFGKTFLQRMLEADLRSELKTLSRGGNSEPEVLGYRETEVIERVIYLAGQGCTDAFPSTVEEGNMLKAAPTVWEDSNENWCHRKWLCSCRLYCPKLRCFSKAVFYLETISGCLMTRKSSCSSSLGLSHLPVGTTFCSTFSGPHVCSS
jgi:hypothetical protein